MHLRMRAALIAVTATALAALGAGIAGASIPSSSGIFYGCVKGSSASDPGELIVKDDGGTGNITCGSGATKIQWNQTGPQGPTGATGTTGPQGPAGPQATAVTVTQDVTFPGAAAGSLTEIETVDCPSGLQAINGGVEQTTAAAGFTEPGGAWILPGSELDPTGSGGPVNPSLPRAVNSGGSWKMAILVTFPQPQFTAITATLYAICE